VALPVYLWHVRYGLEPTEHVAIRATHLSVDDDLDMWLLDGNDNDETVCYVPKGRALWVQRIAKVTNGDA
jgi:hypothetical protein